MSDLENRAAKAELADDALEKALGVRLGPDQWRRRDLGPPDY